MKLTILPITVLTAAAAAAVFSFTSPELHAQEAKAAASVSSSTWEYRALRIPDQQRAASRQSDVRARSSNSQDALNTLGADGWELVAVRGDNSGDPVFYFKRLKR